MRTDLNNPEIAPATRVSSPPETRPGFLRRRRRLLCATTGREQLQQSQIKELLYSITSSVRAAKAE
jgi:hypothetical protein